MNRPYVFINVAMTADGKIDTFQRKGSAISSKRDKERVDKLRAEADAVMVGGRTLLDEDPKLTVKAEALREERVKRGDPFEKTANAKGRKGYKSYPYLGGNVLY